MQITPHLKIVFLDDVYFFMYKGYLEKMPADTEENRMEAVIQIVCQLEHQQCGDWVGYVRRNCDQILANIGSEVTEYNRNTLMDYAKGFNPDVDNN